MVSEIKFGFDDAQQSPGYLLWQVTMLWQRKIKKELDELNITHTQFVLMSVLAWLSQRVNMVTQADIADNSKTDRMMVSKVLRTLESKGFVIRADHPSDTRAKIVEITDQGKLVLQRAILQVEEVDKLFFENNGAAKAHLQALIECNTL